MNIGSKKAGTPPSRPPPPKSGGMSFSFKALEEDNDEDEDLTKCTGKFDKQVSEEREKLARSQLEKERSGSGTKSPEIAHKTQSGTHGGSQKSTTVKTQNSLDKIMDFKKNIQDTLAKKREEFLSESFGSSKDKENSPIADSSLPSADSELFLSLEEPGNDHFEFAEQFYESEQSDSSEKVKEMTHIKLASQDVPDLDEDEPLEMSEEYFNPNGEDFLDLPGVQTMVRQRKRLQKFRKIKPIVPPAPVSLSKLNDKVTGKKDHTFKVESVKEENKDNSKETTNNISNCVIPTNGTKLPVVKLAGGAVLLFLYLIIPLPSYISGLIAGIVLSSGGWVLYFWVTQNSRPTKPIPDDPPLEELPPMLAPEMKDPKGEDGCYKVTITKFNCCFRHKYLPHS